MGSPADQVTSESYLVRSPFLAWRILDGSAVIISPQERELHSMDEVGTAIWRLADGSHTLAQIAQDLSREYAAAPEQILPDVIAFAQELIDRGLAYVCDEPTTEDELESKWG